MSEHTPLLSATSSPFRCKDVEAGEDEVVGDICPMFRLVSHIMLELCLIGIFMWVVASVPVWEPGACLLAAISLITSSMLASYELVCIGRGTDPYSNPYVHAGVMLLRLIIYVYPLVG